MRYPVTTAIGAFSVFVMLSSAAAGQLASRPAEEWSKTLDQPGRIAGLKAVWLTLIPANGRTPTSYTLGAFVFWDVFFFFWLFWSRLTYPVSQFGDNWVWTIYCTVNNSGLSIIDQLDY